MAPWVSAITVEPWEEEREISVGPAIRRWRGEICLFGGVIWNRLLVFPKLAFTQHRTLKRKLRVKKRYFKFMIFLKISTILYSFLGKVQYYILGSARNDIYV